MTGFSRTLVVGLAALWGSTALAQQAAWIQIEAVPSARAAQDRAAAYAQRIDRIEGYRLGNSNWHAIAIGPFDEATAEQERGLLRRQGAIPSDSFVTDGRNFAGQIWPVGGASVAPVITAPLPQPDTPAALPPADLPAAPQPGPADETPAEARRSEALLDAEGRKLLQTALQWEGFYDQGIDGAFGRGTRASMAAWQEARGHEPTGILTTRQRDELLAAYNAVLAGLGMGAVRDDVAGIAIDLPLAMVAFDRYEPPFAHYSATDGADVPKVLLISQAGDVNTLFGMYDIMQTLAIVPEDGFREKRASSFTLIGEGADFISQTEVSARDGAVKGFTLIWPRGDDKRRKRVIDQMSASFAALPGIVMDDLVGEPTEDQRIDLLAGLEIRRPAISRSGFYIDARGHVLTTATAVDQCREITLNEEVPATLTAVDNVTGLAVLTPGQALAPRAFARFQAAVPRLQSEVVLSGYSYEGVLGAPSLTFGTLADLRGLDGEETLKRLDLEAQPGDAGGPVLDVSGAVLGMLVPHPQDGGRTLPRDVSYAVDVETIALFLSANGLSATAADRGAALKSGVLNDLAVDMTVLVSCWR